MNINILIRCLYLIVSIDATQTKTLNTTRAILQTTA